MGEGWGDGCLLGKGTKERGCGNGRSSFDGGTGLSSEDEGGDDLSADGGTNVGASMREGNRGRRWDEGTSIGEGARGLLTGERTMVACRRKGPRGVHGGREEGSPLGKGRYSVDRLGRWRLDG